jgi:hypothetical protein
MRVHRYILKAAVTGHDEEQTIAPCSEGVRDCR